MQLLSIDTNEQHRKMTAQQMLSDVERKIPLQEGWLPFHTSHASSLTSITESLAYCIRRQMKA